MGSAGAKVVLAESFARIFFRNSVATGEVYPCEIATRLCDVLKTGEVVTVDLDKLTVTVKETGKVYQIKPLGDVRPVVDAGGLFNYARKTGMVSWVGFNQVPVYYDRDPRYAGVTKYPLRKLLALAMDGITSASVKPLALASYFGFIFAAASVVIICYALYSWLWVGKTPPGWTSLMMVATTMGACQLFVLAIIGHYLGQMHEQLRNRPLFIVKDVIHKVPSEMESEMEPQVPELQIPSH